MRDLRIRDIARTLLEILLCVYTTHSASCIKIIETFIKTFRRRHRCTLNVEGVFFFSAFVFLLHVEEKKVDVRWCENEKIEKKNTHTLTKKLY